MLGIGDLEASALRLKDTWLPFRMRCVRCRSNLNLLDSVVKFNVECSQLQQGGACGIASTFRCL
jgi:hypothetical protein